MTDDEDDVRERMAEQNDSLINESLRRVYQGMVDEEVPDRFKSLLDQLRAKDQDR